MRPSKRPATNRQRRQSRKLAAKTPTAKALHLTPKPGERTVVAEETVDQVLTLRHRKRMERKVAALDAAGDATPRLRDYRFYELPPKTGWDPLWLWTINGKLLFLDGDPAVVYDWWTRLHPDDRQEFRTLSTRAGMRDNKPYPKIA